MITNINSRHMIVKMLETYSPVVYCNCEWVPATHDLGSHGEMSYTKLAGNELSSHKTDEQTNRESLGCR